MSTTEKILSASLKLISEKGYAAASMENIAVAVGIRKASIYSHFRGKEEILRVLVDRLFSEYSSAIESLVEQNLADKEGIAAYVAEYLGFWQDDDSMRFWYQLFLFPPAELAENLIERSMAAEFRLCEVVSELLEKAGVQAISVEPICSLIYHLLNGIAVSLPVLPQEIAEREISHVVSNIYNAIERAL